MAVVAASARPHTRPVVGQEEEEDEEAKAEADDDGDADDGAQN